VRLLKRRVPRPLAVSLSTLALLVIAVWPVACGTAGPAAEPGAGEGGPLKVLAVETFLADIAQNVAGGRVAVESLMPTGADPHAFELTPSDAVRVAKCDVLVVNGAGFEPNLDTMLENIGEGAEVIEASAGLAGRAPGDPHFWLDPTLVVKYVENIRDGLSKADPAGAAEYQKNAATYIQALGDLDSWIKAQVAAIPPDRRLLVTNHESFGYYADRYGFRIVGTVMPSVGTGASPSAQQLARLIDLIEQTGVRAIFLETGANPDLADQVAKETGITVVTQLYTHSLTGADGPAPTYIAMMKADTEMIVAALK
jgi:ABC-type Zn uptake system ZnuABC Zn-binding protein ZnuA